MRRAAWIMLVVDQNNPGWARIGEWLVDGIDRFYLEPAEMCEVSV